MPWAILMDPTAKCNLRCIGCWAGDYELRPELSLETMDRICREGGELGIHFYVISGGEPLVRKNDLLELARRHPDKMFHIYTNGTLITREFAREAAERGNMVFALSLEGLEASTDARRGKGVFQKIMAAMDILREEGLIFGFSATYTRKNTEELGSEAFIDKMVEKGAAFGWFFTYIPIGRDVDLELMATPEQRAYMFDRITEFRRTKPIFLVDFWNDGEAAVGCIAGGRKYFHINSAGDVEPCAFAHYATCNIHDVSVEEALQNPLFKAYQKRQPFSENLRRPCPIIDHPVVLRDDGEGVGGLLHADERQRDGRRVRREAGRLRGGLGRAGRRDLGEEACGRTRGVGGPRAGGLTSVALHRRATLPAAAGARAGRCTAGAAPPRAPAPRCRRGPTRRSNDMRERKSPPARGGCV